MKKRLWKWDTWVFTPCRRTRTGSAREQSFRAACSLEEDLPEAYFYLGMAYKEVHRYADAEKTFKYVIWIHGALLSEAKEELESIQEILRAGPGSPSTPK